MSRHVNRNNDFEIKKDYEFKGFCLDWEDDIFPKGPKGDSMDKISEIGNKINKGDFDITCFNVHDTELSHFLGYLQNHDFSENQVIPFLHTRAAWNRCNKSFLYNGQDNKERYEKYHNSSYGKYLLDKCGYTEQFEKIKTLHNNHEWSKELTKDEINYLQTECEEVPWYKHNSWSFRSDEFDFDSKGDSILTIGCSYAYGTGLVEEDRFSNLLSKTLGLKNYNLGVSGGSHDQAYLFSQYLIPLLKPKHVVFLGPNIIRNYHFNENLLKYFVLQGFESNLLSEEWLIHPSKPGDSMLFDYDICTNLSGPTETGEPNDIHFQRYVKQMIIQNSTNVYMNKLNASRNVDAVKGLCYENGASFHYFHTDDNQLPFNSTYECLSRNSKENQDKNSTGRLGDLLESLVEDKRRGTEEQVIEWFKKFKLDIDYARDLCHPGKKTNQWLADYFLDSIKKVV